MRRFVTIWLGQLVSALGSAMTSFAFGVWVYLETRSTTLFALNVLAFTLPGIVFAPLIGSVVDRYDRRLVMILSDVGAILTTLGIWALSAGGRLAVWHVYAATFVSATFSSLQWTAYSACASLLVPEQHLGRASGLVSAADALSALLAPLLAGTLYLSVHLAGIVLVDALTFCFAIGALLLVRVPQPEPSLEGAAAGGPWLARIAFGWRYVLARPGLLALLVYFAGLYFIVGMVDPLLQTMLLETSGPQEMGAVLSIVGAGYLGGTLVMSTWGGPRRRMLGVLVVGIGQGLLMAGMGAGRSLSLVAVSACLFSALDPIVGGSSQAFWQAKVPPDIQGRVFSVRRMISLTGLALALLLVGPLSELFEPLLLEGGLLAGSVGRAIGVGAGRGTGLLFLILGALFALLSILGLCYAPLRLADKQIADALPSARPGSVKFTEPG